MLHHTMLGTNDIERSRRFYDAVLGLLGCPAGIDHTAPSGHRRLMYRHDRDFFALSEPIDGQPATGANGGTVGFTCTSTGQVDRFHDLAVANGGTSIEDPPGLRGDRTYLAYVRDPDGNKLCAIHWLPAEARS